MNKQKRKLLRINNLRDLQLYKKYLQKKIFIRKHLMNKHLKNFEQDLDAEYVVRESFKFLKLEGGIWNLIPQLFSRTSLKNLFLPLFSGLSAAMTTSFLVKEKENKHKPPVSKNRENKKFTSSSSYNEDEMFI